MGKKFMDRGYKTDEVEMAKTRIEHKSRDELLTTREKEKLEPPLIHTLYHLDRDTITTIVDLLHDLVSLINICTAIPPVLNVVSVLHFLATGNYQHRVRKLHGIWQPCFSGVLNQVLDALLKHAGFYISLPWTVQEVNDTKIAFHALAGMSKVIGALDCTHVELVVRHAVEVVFGNRKQYHSINVQMVCDAGHPLKPWLLNPVRHPLTRHEEDYNRAHTRTRAVIEQTFGLLKARFRCLSWSGRALIYRPEKVGKIVLACAMLHNMCILRNVPLPPDMTQTPPSEDDDDEEDAAQRPCRDACEGPTVRQSLIAQYF
ncbi:putative nuclease HARBI1 [Ambystoma mexicanum]|uniref:putative nuclease HARBI1 n=1 Tax=Ambystoma mexicanum TaxID=8296 RepID=UPI0037E95DA1